MSHKNISLPNDASARLFATLLGLGMAVMTIANMNEIEGLVLSRAEGLLGQTTTTTTRTEDTATREDAKTETTDTTTTIAQTTSSSAASSKAASTSTSLSTGTATIEQRTESREGGVNSAADYSADADCPRNAQGTCITSEEEVQQIVIYRQCRDKNQNYKIVQGPICGIDNVATENARDIAREYLRNLPKPICLDRDGNQTTDRTQCAPPTPVEPDPIQEQKVIERIENIFIGTKKEEDRRSLSDALGIAQLRIQKLLVSKVYKFSDSDKKELTSQVVWIQQQLQHFDGRTAFTEADIQKGRVSLVASLQKIQGMITTQKRLLAEQAPRLENIVTRIDDLVTRVGTVLRELERDGLDVPDEVTEGYLTSKIYLTDAKRTCSMRRPASCALLGKALDEIAKMREPLCALPSDRLTFCN
ncbi:MAG TPA: hypothetical protein VI913_00695 [Candidatus Peribacteraceae bacterium]|nr:hypothetical protein [Candidatus Peribacteraceae bacterium]